MKPKVSVSVITYNHEKYIAQAIESFLMQKTLFPIEIVIGDDLSTDRTREICAEYQKKYPEIIRLILREKNIGIFKNFFDSIKKCAGEYVAICEGDDYWTDPLKLQKQVDALEKRPECDMCFHPAVMKYMDKSKPDVKKSYYGNEQKIFSAKDVILGGGSFCPTPSLFFRKSMFDNLEKFNIDKSNDYLLQIFGSLRGGLLYIGDFMSVYRFQGASSWTENNKKFEHALEHTQSMCDTLERLDGYLDYRYSEEIKHTITQLNYSIWRRFKKLDKKEFNDYTDIQSQIKELRMYKKPFIKIVFTGFIKKFFIKGLFKSDRSHNPQTS